MDKKIQSALISVFYKDGLDIVAKTLSALGIKIYSTGGTQQYIEALGIEVVGVEQLTGYPSILGGRVKTLHPAVFGAILGRRGVDTDAAEMKEFNIPEIDLVVVDLYPFQETVASTTDETTIIEKIDIGGPSMLRAAAKNFKDVAVISDKSQYAPFVEMLQSGGGLLSLEERKQLAISAFDTCSAYDLAISNYFHKQYIASAYATKQTVLRYGENPHQQAKYFGNIDEVFTQLHGKETSYNNLVDIDAALQLMADWPTSSDNLEAIFAIIKHTNVCGMAQRNTVKESWDAALAGDPESAFGGILATNRPVDKATAQAISEIFFEVLIAPSFADDAMAILTAKKNRILLQLNKLESALQPSGYRSLLNGMLIQGADKGNFTTWKETGARETTDTEKTDLQFANIICKHLKSNAIAIVKNGQLIGKGCGQTSRIDALRQAVAKAHQFKFSLQGAVMASDAFFPFDDCVKLGHEAGIEAFIQPGGSIRDNDSIEYCKSNNLAMVITEMRHFKH